MTHHADIVTTARALASHLDDLRHAIAAAGDLDYITRPPAGVSGSVGAHVRHVLDHVRAILDARPDGVVSYDQRHRDTPIERHRASGISALAAATRDLQAWAARMTDRPIAVEARLDRTGRSVLVSSSIGRELLFVLQHTVHHQALIAVLLADSGTPLPDRFGYAASTPLPT